MGCIIVNLSMLLTSSILFLIMSYKRDHHKIKLPSYILICNLIKWMRLVKYLNDYPKFLNEKYGT